MVDGEVVRPINCFARNKAWPPVECDFEQVAAKMQVLNDRQNAKSDATGSFNNQWDIPIRFGFRNLDPPGLPKGLPIVEAPYQGLRRREGIRPGTCSDFALQYWW